MQNLQMEISIKPICDWHICLTASADERLACIKQTSFHSTTLFIGPLRTTGHKIKWLPTLLLHFRATYLCLPLYLSFYNGTFPSFFFLYSSSNLYPPTPISFVLSSCLDFSRSLSSGLSHLHTVISVINSVRALKGKTPKGSHLQNVDAVCCYQLWLMDKSWQHVPLSEFLYSHTLWEPIFTIGTTAALACWKRIHWWQWGRGEIESIESVSEADHRLRSSHRRLVTSVCCVSVMR